MDGVDREVALWLLAWVLIWRPAALLVSLLVGADMIWKVDVVFMGARPPRPPVLASLVGSAHGFVGIVQRSQSLSARFIHR